MGISSSKVVKKLEEKDKLVLIMGGSGAGKSAFFDLICSDGHSTRADSRLGPSNDGFGFVRWEVVYNEQKHSIVVMDSKAIAEHTDEIKKALSSKKLEKKNIQLLGILLLQNITSNRVTGNSPATTFPFPSIMRDICGTTDPEAERKRKTNLVLTHMDLRSAKSTENKRYDAYCALFNQSYGKAGDGQNHIFEHTNTRESAAKILEEIVRRGLVLLH